MELKKKIFAGIATGALLANVMTPMAFAGTTIEISGNGGDSYNKVEVDLENEVDIDQNNTANFTNNIEGDATTGGNDANGNVGGDVNIETGDATVDVTVDNMANVNYADVECCGTGDTEIEISGNGSGSQNTVKLDADGKDNGIDIDQDNSATFTNNVKFLDAKTGKNDANGNVGGDVSVMTGDATVSVAVSNAGNYNSARVAGGDSNGSLSLIITGNGANEGGDEPCVKGYDEHQSCGFGSVNNLIDVELENEIDVDQDNTARFTNNIEGDAKTGLNDANGNVGGKVEISTGDAEVDVTVDNMANFNWADLSCGCVLDDVMAKIAGNGSGSQNKIEAELENEQDVDQDNGATFNNTAQYLDAKTGHNDADGNVGDVGSDPAVETGDADVTVDVSNSANTNGVGGEAPEWPEMNAFGLSLSLNLNFSDLLDYLGL